MLEYNLIFEYDSKAAGAFQSVVVSFIEKGLKKLTLNDFSWSHIEGCSICIFEVEFASEQDNKHFDRGIKNLLKAQRMVARKIKNKLRCYKIESK